MTLVTDRPDQKPDGMVLRRISLERLEDRASLLRSIDTYRREADASGAMEKCDEYNRQAVEILSAAKLMAALDLSTEDPRIVERYGRNDPTYHLRASEDFAGGAPQMIRNLCVARRLVEAGARIVSLNFSRWDWHGENGNGKMFERGRLLFPILDQGLAALVMDLHERGLEKDVSVVVWGEFSRDPRITKDGGRHHWPRVNFAVLAGGGMRTGQVIGATDRLGQEVIERPISFQEVFATLYHNLGIDVRTATVDDRSGRPQYLVDSGVEPIRELL